MNTILIRIRELITHLGISDTSFAQNIDIGQTTLSNMFQRESDPKSEVLQKIVSTYHVNSEWLLMGEGNMFTSPKDTLPCQQTKIPLLRQRVSCGPGQNWEESDSVESYIEPLSLVPSMQGKKVCAFRVRGTSMVGAGINDGDVILFNSETEEVLNDDIYVFALEGNVYCKLLKFDEISRRIEIYSLHSPKMEDAELLRTLDANSPESAETFHLFGRVLAWIRENKICWR